MIINKLSEKINSLYPLSSNAFKLFVSCAQQNELSKGQSLLSEGQICNHLYFVESGHLRTYMSKDGNEINLNFTFDGNFLSNIKSLKTNQPSEYNIKAGEKSLVTLFDKSILLDLYSISKEIELLCRKILGYMVIESDEHLEFHKLQTPKERYLFLLKYEPQMVQRVPVSQLSSYLGVARETLSRIRKSIY